MTALARTRRDIEAAWRSFVVDGKLRDSLRPEIRRSWQRARSEWHIDPELQACPSARAAGVLAPGEPDEYVEAASPLVKDFADRLAPDGHVVACFDADGVMLALEGNHRTRSRLADVNFAPGACWAEHGAGTNGIGTALIEARPVEVFASEHFVEAWQPWTCASVPVRSCGRVVGVVDITSPWNAYNPALLLTAEALARAIEGRLEAATARRQGTILLQVARDALRARDEFLAVASHELKTPLTPLQLRLQSLQRLVTREGVRPDADRIVEALRGADRHVRRLVRFIDGLLDASRGARGPPRLALEPTELGAVVRDVVAQHRDDLERQGCECVVIAPREVVGRWDPARIAQAFAQLLVNATKYAPGRIEVEVDAERDSARLRVRDHGPGLAPEDQERVFLPFERAVSYQEVAGFGLGLHLVRQIAEAHGGTVRVESTLGEGSTFVLELRCGAQPRALDPAQEPSGDAPSSEGATRAPGTCG